MKSEKWKVKNETSLKVAPLVLPHSPPPQQGPLSTDRYATNVGSVGGIIVVQQRPYESIDKSQNLRRYAKRYSFHTINTINNNTLLYLHILHCVLLSMLGWLLFVVLPLSSSSTSCVIFYPPNYINWGGIDGSKVCHPPPPPEGTNRSGSLIVACMV